MGNLTHLANKVIHTGGANAYVMALSFLLVVITARAYGPEERGYIALITVWVALSSLTAGLSLGQVAMHRMTQFGPGRTSVLLQGKLLKLALVFGAATVIVLGAIGCSPIANSLSLLPKGVLLSGLLAVPFMILEQYFRPLLIGSGKIKEANQALVVGRTVGFLFALSGPVLNLLPFWAVVTAVSIGQIVVSLLMIFFSRDVRESSEYQVVPSNKLSLSSLMKDGLKLHFNAIGAVLINSSGVLVLGQYSNSSEVAYYQLALQLLNTILVLPQAVATVLSGRVAELGTGDSWAEYRATCALALLLMAGLAVASSLISPYLVRGLVGGEFEPSIIIFKLMLFGLPGITFSILMGPQWIARGFFLHASLITVAIGLISVTTSIWSIRNYGEIGVVYSFLATWVVSVLGNGAMFLYCELCYRKSSHL